MPMTMPIGGRTTTRQSVGGFDRGGSPLQAVRAEKSSFMLGDAFSAEVVGTRRTAGNGFPIRMDQASL